MPTDEPIKTGDLDNTWYKKLLGYNRTFLEIDVPLLSFDKSKKDDIALTNDGGKILEYTYFSLIMSKSRRLALYTASNFDSEKCLVLFNLYFKLVVMYFVETLYFIK